MAKLWEEYELTLSAAQELCVSIEEGGRAAPPVSEAQNQGSGQCGT